MNSKCFYPILLLLLSACSKNGKIDSVNPNQPYSIAEGRLVGNIRVFARQGEILDNSLVNYYKDKEFDNLQGYTNMILLGHQGIDTIWFKRDGEAQAYQNYAYRKYKYKAVGNRYEFVSKDTLQAYTFFDLYSKTIAYFITQPRPAVFQEYLYSSVPQYSFAYRNIEKLYCYPKANTVEIPMITFVWYNKQPPAAGNYAYNKFGELDKDFYKSINAGDTVILRETIITYKN